MKYVEYIHTHPDRPNKQHTSFSFPSYAHENPGFAAKEENRVLQMLSGHFSQRGGKKISPCLFCGRLHNHTVFVISTADFTTVIWQEILALVTLIYIMRDFFRNKSSTASLKTTGREKLTYQNRHEDGKAFAGLDTVQYGMLRAQFWCHQGRRRGSGHRLRQSGALEERWQRQGSQG
jgi:hypothetical protein